MSIATWICMGIATAVLTVAPSAADPLKRNHGVNKRQESPNPPVAPTTQPGSDKGFRDHAMTNERLDLKKLEQHYRADGILTPAERKDLDQRMKSIEKGTQQ
jgi:hypothetical protein